MPKRSFALDKDGPKRLEMQWGAFWRDFKVTLDGETVLTASGQAELKAGRTAKLPDGSTLAVRLNTGFGNVGLEVTRDGVPLPGTASDPAAQVKLAGGIVYFLAGFNALIGIIAYAFDVRFLKENFGAIFGVLGYFTMKRSMAVAGSGHTPNFGFVFMRIMFIIAMVRGASAIAKLKSAA